MPGKQIYIDSTASPRLVQKYKLLKKRIKVQLVVIINIIFKIII